MTLVFYHYKTPTSVHRYIVSVAHLTTRTGKVGEKRYLQLCISNPNATLTHYHRSFTNCAVFYVPVTSQSYYTTFIVLSIIIILFYFLIFNFFYFSLYFVYDLMIIIK